MPSIVRDYSEADQMRSVWSSESASHPCCASASFNHVELARRRSGLYVGETLPQFRKRKSAGELLPFTQYRRFDQIATQGGTRSLTWKVDCVAGGCFRTATVASCNIFEDFLSIPTISSYEGIAGRYESKLGSLLTEAAGDASDAWDAATFLRELPQAMQMLAGVGFKMIRHLARKPSKEGSSAWLQWQFGWKPLYNDILQVVELITESDGKPVKRLVGRSKASYTEETPISGSLSLGNGEIHNYTGTDISTISLKATVSLDIRNPLSKIELNPAVVAWEAVPYSFVVDYFFNVGNWLKSFSNIALSSGYVASVGMSIDRLIDCTLSGEKGPVLQAYNASGRAHISGNYKFRSPRSVNYNFPLFRGPEFLSFTRVLNLIALALQRALK